MNMVKMKMSELMSAPTYDELRELEEAEKRVPVFDEDSPEMTTEQLIQFKRMHEDRTK